MMTASRIIRSILFDAIIYFWSFLYLTLCIPLCAFKKDMMIFYQFWVHTVLFLMQHLLKLTVRIDGMEHYNNAVKNGPIILAIQHQSAIDTILPMIFFNHFTFVVKEELSKVPILGFHLKKLNAIFLNRADGFSSLKKLLKHAKEHYEQGQSILIFPQGHRANPDEFYPSKPGIYMIYKHLNCPVIPVSLNTGYFWPRKAIIKEGGDIILNVHPPLFPGLKREHFLSSIDDCFNGEA